MARVTMDLADVKLVLVTVYYRNRTQRKAMRLAADERFKAGRAFLDRATPTTWGRLVAASRKLIAAERADRAGEEQREEAQRLRRLRRIQQPQEPEPAP